MGPSVPLRVEHSAYLSLEFLNHSVALGYFVHLPSFFHSPITALHLYLKSKFVPK